MMIVKGEGEGPEKGQEVTVNYVGRLEDGTIFDNSADHGEPLKINIGTGQVIEGWDQGIMAMKLGEKADLFIQSKYGYGDMGSPPKIPGGATLVFTVELIQIAERRPTRWQMSDDELIQVALRQKDDGNIKFKEKKFKEAEGHYQDAISHLDTVKIENEDLQKLKIICYQNLSVSLNNTGDHKDAVQSCTLALKIDPNALKALYQRYTAHLKMKNFEEATDDLKAAIKLNPQDKKMRTDFENLKTLKKKHSQTQQAAMAKFLSEGVYNEKEVVKAKKNFDKLPAFDQENAQTFFDIEIGNEGEEKQAGRVVFELFSKQVPKTAENFRAICTGEKGDGLHYKDNIFHRVIGGFMAQGGDITNQNGTGGKSIYGHKFADEQVWFPHTHAGVLSMANAGADTNGSQFFICFGPTSHLDDKHTIYGRVIHNYKFVELIENNKVGAQDKPLQQVRVVDCGELLGDDKLTAENADFLASFSEIPMNTTDFHDPVNQLENDGDESPDEENKD